MVRQPPPNGLWARPRRAPERRIQPQATVLALGVYRADHPTNIGHIVRALSSADAHRVLQHWAAIGGDVGDDEVACVTRIRRSEAVPKFVLINQMLANVNVHRFDYLIIIDDDILIPDRFVDRFLIAQAAVGFALAQPARTPDSYLDHPIVVQEAGTFARQTLWVEVGPLVSIHRSVYDIVLPFDLRSPMGWGYENVWAYELSRRSLTMGIIDAQAVGHTLRPQHAHYDAAEAEEALRRMLSQRPHLNTEECQQVLARWADAPAGSPRNDAAVPFGTAELCRALEAEAGRFVLDWHTGLPVDEILPEHVVFSPFQAPPGPLPYFGKSIDVVFTSTSTAGAREEAVRVARRAVVTCGSDGRFAVEWLAREFDEVPAMPVVRPPSNGRRVLICSPRLPEFDRESGSRRILDHIECFQEMGWTVTFAAESADPTSRYARLLRERGVQTQCDFANLDRLWAMGQFDLALCAFWQIAERLLPAIRAHSRHTRAVVDSVDLHFLRNGRRISPGWDYRGGEVEPQHGEEMRRELAAYEAADAVLTVSGNEAAILREMSGERVLPLVAPDGEDLPRSTTPWPRRRGIVFVGNFRHPPNAEAVDWLLREIVPRLPEHVRANHPVYIVGNDLGDDVRALAAGVANVVVVGWVPSVVTYLSNSRVMVAPLLHGAGTKRKLIQALMIGAPSVVTTIAAEGLPVRHEEQILLADDPDTFASSIGRLACDDVLCERLARSGRAAVEPIHSRTAARAALQHAVETVMASSQASSHARAWTSHAPAAHPRPMPQGGHH